MTTRHRRFFNWKKIICFSASACESVMNWMRYANESSRFITIEGESYLLRWSGIHWSCICWSHFLRSQELHCCKGYRQRCIEKRRKNNHKKARQKILCACQNLLTVSPINNGWAVKDLKYVCHRWDWNLVGKKIWVWNNHHLKQLIMIEDMLVRITDYAKLLKVLEPYAEFRSIHEFKHKLIPYHTRVQTTQELILNRSKDIALFQGDLKENRGCNQQWKGVKAQVTQLFKYH